MSEHPNTGGPQVSGTVHPPQIPASVPESLAQLSPEATRFLSAAAALGAHFVLDDVAELLGVSPRSLQRPLQETMSTRIVLSAGQVLAFRNEGIRGEIYAGAPESVRDTAPRTTPGCARQPLDLTALNLRLELASTLVLSGDNVGAIHEAETVLARPGLPVASYAAAESARVLALLSDGTFASARRSAEAILAGEGRHGGDVALAGALTVLSISAWTAGHLTDALSLMRGADGRAAAGADVGHRAFLRAALRRMQIVTGERDAEARALPLAADDTGDGGEHQAAPWCITLAFLRSRDLLDYGDVDGAIRASERALTLATCSGTQFLLAMVQGVMATISLLRDDPDGAEARLELARSDLGPLASNEIQNRLVWIRARVREATAGPGAALQCLERVCADVTAFVPMLVEEPGSAAWFVRLALSQGDEARARIVACETEQLLADNRSFPCIRAIVLHAADFSTATSTPSITPLRCTGSRGPAHPRPRTPPRCSTSSAAVRTRASIWNAHSRATPWPAPNATRIASAPGSAPRHTRGETAPDGPWMAGRA